MKISLAGLAICLLAAATAGAQSLSVTYLEGEAQVRSSSSWKVLSIGDSVPLEASVRVEEQGMVQLKGAGLDFVLNRPGTYVLKDVVAARRQLSAAGVGAALANTLRYLASGPAAPQSTAAGTRGANQGLSENQGWVENDAQVFLDAGRQYLSSGQYDKALEQFGQALDSATDEEVPEIHYYLAYASSLKGDVREAWDEIADLEPAMSVAWAYDFVLLKANLLEDASAYGEAVTWLRQSDNDLSKDARRAPTYYFLLGIGCRGSGDTESAQQAFSKVIEIAPGGDLGRAAEKMLATP